MALISRGSSTGMAAITGSGRRFPAPSNTVHGHSPQANADPYRESLRDIETCRLGERRACSSKLKISLSEPGASAKRGPALGRWAGCQRWLYSRRDWRIRSDAAIWPSGSSPRLRGRCTVDEELAPVGPDQYRLIALADDHRSGLSVFPHWAHSSPPTALGEDAHAADLRGNIPSFIARSRMASSSTTFMPSTRCSCRKPEPSTSWTGLRRLCPPLCDCTRAGAFYRHAPRPRTSHAHRRLFGVSTDRSTRHPICDQPSPWTASTVRITPNWRRIRFKDARVRQDAGLHHGQRHLASGRHHLRALDKRWQVELFFKWIKQRSSDQAVLRHVGERGEDADLDPSRSTSSSPSSRSASTWTPNRSTFVTDPSYVTTIEKMPIHQALAGDRKQATLRK